MLNIELTLKMEILYICLNTLRPRQNGRRFADDTFKCIFLNANVRISIKISQRFVPKDPINNNPELAQIMAWRRTGDKPLSEPMMTQFNDAYMRHSAWVNSLIFQIYSRYQWLVLIFCRPDAILQDGRRDFVRNRGTFRASVLPQASLPPFWMRISRFDWA